MHPLTFMESEASEDDVFTACCLSRCAPTFNFFANSPYKEAGPFGTAALSMDA